MVDSSNMDLKYVNPTNENGVTSIFNPTDFFFCKIDKIELKNEPHIFCLQKMSWLFTKQDSSWFSCRSYEWNEPIFSCIYESILWNSKNSNVIF